jgi:deoxyribodipyrimidine photo-lyase
MRALTATGWLNFRMRAMLVSFVSYDLWQHWREPALILARRWVDYEPGIHYCQFQMQSGTSGNRTIRIYNPIKQGQQHDPAGEFIRRWVPELASVSGAFIHTPWLMARSAQEQAGCRIGTHYPAPIVDHEAAQRRARAAIAAVRARPETREETMAVYAKHGSRRPLPKRAKQAPIHPGQLRMEL